MHSLELVDLAAVVAVHGPALLYQREMLPEEAVQAYWLASRARFDRWHRSLADCRHLIDSQAFEDIRTWWKTNGGLLEEILLSEPLTRVYATLAAVLDENRDHEEVAPIAHSVYVTHLEARSRALRMLLDCQVVSLDSAVMVNKLRRTVERWCDALLGHLVADSPQTGERYSFEHSRFRALAHDVAQLPHGASRDAAGWLMAAALAQSLRTSVRPEAMYPEQNRAIADSVIMCLRPDLFDSVGIYKSLWLHRLQRGAEQADRVLSQLAQADISGCDILGGFETIRSKRFGRL